MQSEAREPPRMRPITLSSATTDTIQIVKVLRPFRVASCATGHNPRVWWQWYRWRMLGIRVGLLCGATYRGLPWLTTCVVFAAMVLVPIIIAQMWNYTGDHGRTLDCCLHLSFSALWLILAGFAAGSLIGRATMRAAVR
jgi:hypothetical protein